jgi:flagellar basal-body rod modification protein FlgD
MDIGAIAATGGTATLDSEVFSENIETFLTLLTTQLQNQDPLDPLDSNEFTQQLIQFAEIEQAIKVNDNLEAQLAVEVTSMMADLSNYIGKTIESVGSDGQLTDGAMTFSYTLNKEADSSTIVITDEAGLPVYSTSGETLAGVHEFTWDGVDSNGLQLPDGVYGIAVNALDGEGNATAATTASQGLVSGVHLIDGIPYLDVGGINVPLADLMSVKSTPTPPA